MAMALQEKHRVALTATPPSQMTSQTSGSPRACASAAACAAGSRNIGAAVIVVGRGAMVVVGGAVLSQACGCRLQHQAFLAAPQLVLHVACPSTQLK